ncbi:hypothetical protein QDX21_07115 [Auritidibacter ignavus]|uniref:Uncharacterized protein n=1 Tax=Auritidibacter ignavus TaxID=678932 RepID=A0AAJ6AF40_9MICC|nr:hypothetical protein [Auritidibacter ignavus]WGH92105.1 hypothetical protein QDX21_07115 [Auritidibacter ignavus]
MKLKPSKSFKQPGDFQQKGFKKRNPVENPLDSVEYTGDLEKDSASELTAIQKGFRERKEREKDRFVEATDSEFWFAVCFKNRGHKEKFLKAIDALPIGDKYLDGYKLAKLLGVDLEVD